MHVPPRLRPVEEALAGAAVAAAARLGAAGARDGSRPQRLPVGGARGGAAVGALPRPAPAPAGTAPRRRRQGHPSRRPGRDRGLLRAPAAPGAGSVAGARAGPGDRRDRARRAARRAGRERAPPRHRDPGGPGHPAGRHPAFTLRAAESGGVRNRPLNRHESAARGARGRPGASSPRRGNRAVLIWVNGPSNGRLASKQPPYAEAVARKVPRRPRPLTPSAPEGPAMTAWRRPAPAVLPSPSASRR